MNREQTPVKRAWDMPVLVDMTNVSVTASGGVPADGEYHCINSPYTSRFTSNYDLTTSGSTIPVPCDFT